jgi:hypothetical protein
MLGALGKLVECYLERHGYNILKIIVKAARAQNDNREQLT